MAYFPFFIDIAGQSGLIVGGGSMALRKIEKLLPYGPRLTVAAPTISPEIQAIPGLTLLERPFDPSMLEGMLFVISAAGSREGNHAVSQACGERDILVNVVDCREDCGFLFPALVKDGPLSVGISTGGASPSAAVWLKKQITPLLPERFADILTALEELRGDVRAAVPDPQRRMDFYARMFDLCMENRAPLERAKAETLLEAFRQEEALS